MLQILHIELCHVYRKLGDLESELEIINLYLSKENRKSLSWFKKRLNEVEKLIGENKKVR